MKHFLEIQAFVQGPVNQAWEVFTNPDYIRLWNHASADWHCPQASNDLQEGSKFSYTMAAKDGSFSFDLKGNFTRVEAPYSLRYSLADGRQVEVDFVETETGVRVNQRFEPEQENPEDMQRMGWQAILDNYARHASQ